MASPVILTDASAAGTEAREALRAANGVRLVEPVEEGTGVQHLPGGVYGFTYSPAVEAPLFRTFRYRAYEVHKLAGGEALVIGFANRADADRLAAAAEPVELTIQHDADGSADTLVGIPYSRIAQHRQFAIRNTPGITFLVNPG